MHPTVYILPLILVGALAIKGIASTEKRLEIPQEVRADLAWVLSDSPTRQDTVFVLQMDEVFRMRDKKFWAEVLLSARDYHTFRARVDEYRKKYLSGKPDPRRPLGTWEQILAALDYGNLHFATSIFASPRDVRWDLLFNVKEKYGFGVPSEAWTTSGLVPDQTDGVLGGKRDLYILVWDALDHEEVCHSDTLGGMPTRIIEERQLKTPEGMLISPYTDYSVFRNPDTSYDVGVAVCITGNMLTNRTLAIGKLRMTLTLTGSNGHVWTDTVEGDLSTIRSLLRRAENISGQAVYGYLGVKNLPPGTYQSELNIHGARHNRSALIRKKVIVPSPNVGEGMSDIVLLAQGVIRGDGEVMGIERDTLLLSDPLRTVLRGHPIYGKLHPYTEWTIPPGLDSEMVVSVVIDSEPIKTDVITGPLRAVADEQGRPVTFTGKPADRRKDDEKPNDRKKVLAFSRVITVHGSKVVFDWPVELTGNSQIAKLPPGAYWMKVHIEGHGPDGKFSRSGELAVRIN